MTTQAHSDRLIINGVRFAPIWGMSGVENFFGEGWPHHKLLKRLGILNFGGMTFVAKTTTFDSREGNMPLDENLMPKEINPRCIHVSPLSKRVVNAVGLSGPGLKDLLDRGNWQRRRMPFQISFMSVADSTDKRLDETKQYVDTMLSHKCEFATKFGSQDNESCPNTGHENAGEKEIELKLDILEDLHNAGIPNILKFGLDTPPEVVKRMENHPALDGICIPNTIKFGSMGLPWEKWYGKVSPLVRRGLDPKFSGGLSGEPLREISLAWVKELRNLGFKKHINAGGGLLRPEHVDLFMQAGADSVSIGTVAIIRPWRVQHIISRAYELYADAL